MTRLRDANMFMYICVRMYVSVVCACQAPARFCEDDMEKKAAFGFIITGSAALLQWRRYLN